MAAINVRFQFRRLAQLLVAEAAVAAATGHAGTTGRLREQIVQRFLRPHLPKSIDVRSGVIIDSKGQQSRQQDIILVDVRHPTISVGSEDEALVVAESVLATIEVKSNLTSTELRSTLESIAQTKRLFRSGEHRYEKRGVQITFPTPLPILTYIFAFDGAGLELLLYEIYSFTKANNDGGLAPDAICILPKGVILRSQLMPTVKAAANGKDTVATMPSGLSVQCTAQPLLKDALFSFYGRLYDDVVPLQIIHYDLDPYFRDDDLQ